MNYTKEQTDYIVEEYQKDPCRATVDRLAEEIDKSPKSVIGKLSREGVYRREIYRTKTGEMPIRKIEIVSEIAELLGLDSEKLTGLDKSPKQVLKLLHTTLENQ